MDILSIHSTTQPRDAPLAALPGDLRDALDELQAHGGTGGPEVPGQAQSRRWVSKGDEKPGFGGKCAIYTLPNYTPTTTKAHWLRLRKPLYPMVLNASNRSGS